MLAVGSDEITLTRLKDPPDAITEVFYQVEKSGRVKVESEVIQGMHLQFEQGKSHARLSVFYENTTAKSISPKYTIRLYNPFGILLGGLQVPEDGETPEALIAPGAEGIKSLTARISRLDSLFRHADIKGYPADFFSVKWLSISDANTNQVEQRSAGQPSTLSESDSEGDEKPHPEAKDRSR